MKLSDSKIFDALNLILYVIQAKFDILRKNSLLLSYIDFFILILIILTYIVSSFANSEITGVVSFFVPFFVVLKVLVTKGEKIELEQCNFYFLIYLFICLISCFVSSMPVESLLGFMKTLIYAAFYFALCMFLKNNRKYITVLLAALAFIVSIESIIALMQNAAQVQNLATWQDTSYVNPENVLVRVYGTLKPYNPNLLGGFLAAGLPAAGAIFALCLKNGKIKSAIISFICFIISVLAIFLTGSRGAYAALFVIITGIAACSFQIFFFDFKSEISKKLWKIITSLCLAGLIGFISLNHGIFSRIMSVFMMRADSSTSFRMNVYNSAIQMFQDNWFWGIGCGNKVFREIYGLYMMSGFDALSCYNVFLEIAVESGIFALIAYLAFLFSLLGAAVKKFLTCRDFYYKILLFVSFISIAAVMFHGIFDTIYFRPQIQYIFWTMAAILTVLARENETEKQ